MSALRPATHLVVCQRIAYRVRRECDLFRHAGGPLGSCLVAAGAVR